VPHVRCRNCCSCHRHAQPLSTHAAAPLASSWFTSALRIVWLIDALFTAILRIVTPLFACQFTTALLAAS
tara:strand:+ start:298 stop:507 length:210 start_codon:yes stop_codon:yes gene_type:complete